MYLIQTVERIQLQNDDFRVTDTGVIMEGDNVVATLGISFAATSRYTYEIRERIVCYGRRRKSCRCCWNSRRYLFDATRIS